MTPSVNRYLLVLFNSVQFGRKMVSAKEFWEAIKREFDSAR